MGHQQHFQYRFQRRRHPPHPARSVGLLSQRQRPLSALYGHPGRAGGAERPQHTDGGHADRLRAAGCLRGDRCRAALHAGSVLRPSDLLRGLRGRHALYAAMRDHPHGGRSDPRHHTGRCCRGGTAAQHGADAALPTGKGGAQRTGGFGAEPPGAGKAWQRGAAAGAADRHPYAGGRSVL